MQLKVEVALLHALQAVEVFLADGNALFGGCRAGGVCGVCSDGLAGHIGFLSLGQ